MSGRYSFVFYNFDRLTTIDIEPAHHLLDTLPFNYNLDNHLRNTAKRISSRTAPRSTNSLSGTMRVFSALVMGLSMLSVILAAAIPAGLDGAIASTTLAVSSLAASSVSSAPSAGHAAADKVAAQVHPSIFEIPATAPVAAASATVTNVVTSSSSLSLAASPTETVHHAGPYLPYQCSTAWSLEESLPNPAECSYCYANRTEECYEALNCEWSYRLDALICPVGLPAASSSSSAPASATPVPVQYATPLERCWVQYEFVLDEFDIWGVNWDQKKLDGKGTPGWGKGLYHQLHGCGALSHWRFEPVRPSPGRPWTFHAWGRTTIMKGRCIQRAMKSAGAPRGHCSGST
ncbi:hypothetical protein LTR59_007346 [Friedmanniomyces endolithicus]|nr:hypothetical protein LTR38_009871 [Friedmanniomyces endolithicus]KAK0795799.1 hypothetical protein LTR59_007346 [Friedmanniomyces endolithicus]KAK0807551.1 hypothetical protein LTR75_006628 [Friedmanniomyces endolithicus]KAK0830616.1 hypothetical protein LTR03_015825 [Friedmanniomyces endolithicus]